MMTNYMTTAMLTTLELLELWSKLQPSKCDVSHSEEVAYLGNDYGFVDYKGRDARSRAIIRVAAQDVLIDDEAAITMNIRKGGSIVHFEDAPGYFKGPAHIMWLQALIIWLNSNK